MIDNFERDVIGKLSPDPNAELTIHTHTMSSTASSEDENSRSPEESTRMGLWECEPLYYSVPGRTDKSRRGKAYRSRTDGELKCFEAHDGVIYKPGDHVYIETGTHDPYLICSITMFKMTKRDQLSVKVNRYYRPEDVPEVSLSLIVQERNEMECDQDQMDLAHQRELFSSEQSLVYGIASLRGKCVINSVRDLRSLDPSVDVTKPNIFVSCLAYNHDSSRLAAVQGEIRVGGSYQAKLPQQPSCSVADEPDRDELLYRPDQIDPEMEDKFINLARSFRMFIFMSHKMTDFERKARTADRCKDDAIVTLHRCGYKFEDALREMNANDRLLASDVNYMTADDAKKFGRGLKQYGKNFLKISREMLPLHSRDQLVSFYYLWKKTKDSHKPKALGRQRNQTAAIKRNSKNGQPKDSRPASTELLDYASASESEVEASEAEGKPIKYACHHCYGSKSKDWHHAGKDHQLLCTDCRLFYKKYGQLRPVDRPSTVPPCLFKDGSNGIEEEELGVRTRAGKKERRRTPSMGDDRRSPSQAQSIHEFDLEKRPIHKNGKRKRGHPASVNGSAKKKSREEDRERSVETKDIEESADQLNSSSGSAESGEKMETQSEPDREIKRELTTPTEERKLFTMVSSSPCFESLHVPTISSIKSEPVDRRLQMETSDPTETAVTPRHPIKTERSQEPTTPSHIEMDATPSTAQSSEEVASTSAVQPPEQSIDSRFSAAGQNTDAESFEGETDIFIADEPEIWNGDGNETVFNMKNGLFILATKWKDGQRSSRTDLKYRVKDGCVDWVTRKREKAEKANQPQVTPTPTVTNKKEPSSHPTPSLPPGITMNGMMASGLPPGMNPMMMQMMQMNPMLQQQFMQEQAVAMQQHAQQQQQQQQQAQQAMIEKVHMELLRQQSGGRAGMPQTPMGPFGVIPNAHPGIGMPFGAGDPMVQLMMQQQMQQHAAHQQAQQAAAAAQQHAQQQMAVQQQMQQMPGIDQMMLNRAMEMQLALATGMHPGMMANMQMQHPQMMANISVSEMMRRLQSEGGLRPPQ